jgi:hypothetical protein
MSTFWESMIFRRSRRGNLSIFIFKNDTEPTFVLTKSGDSLDPEFFALPIDFILDMVAASVFLERDEPTQGCS